MEEKKRSVLLQVSEYEESACRGSLHRPFCQGNQTALTFHKGNALAAFRVFDGGGIGFLDRVRVKFFASNIDNLYRKDSYYSRFLR